ncbi:MAG: (deoxy)nucleoside triphosphate pyrophosphohydrolase [Fibrobacterales bacterium]|nr:(deoxy)nucleoside triphosphate pyrophosphohydrolase [Fibrobacterales bacterium]
MPEPKRIDVVAGILLKEGRIFATQRGKGEFKGGWEFPGGKIEPGETPQAALARELREELAVEVAVGGLLCVVEHDYPAFHLSMRCFLCNIVSGEPTLLEHEAAKWLKPSELRSVTWLPADVSVVERLEAEFGRQSGDPRFLDS